MMGEGYRVISKEGAERREASEEREKKNRSEEGAGRRK